jgi:hypothetical protein
MKTEIKFTGTSYYIMIGYMEKYILQARYLGMDWNEYLKTLKEEYNGLDVVSEVYFKNKEDIERAQEWIDSLMIMKLLTSNEIIEINSIEDAQEFMIHLQTYSLLQQYKIIKQMTQARIAKEYLLKTLEWLDFCKKNRKYLLNTKIGEMVENNIPDNEIEEYMKTL